MENQREKSISRQPIDIDIEIVNSPMAIDIISIDDSDVTVLAVEVLVFSIDDGIDEVTYWQCKIDINPVTEVLIYWYCGEGSLLIQGKYWSGRKSLAIIDIIIDRQRIGNDDIVSPMTNDPWRHGNQCQCIEKWGRKAWANDHWNEVTNQIFNDIDQWYWWPVLCNYWW